jgi:hypothetical protein
MQADYRKVKRRITRDVFVLCIVYRSLNSALIDYKQRMCDARSANYDKSASAVN